MSKNTRVVRKSLNRKGPLAVDPSKLDPNFKYRWVPKRDDRLEDRRGEGYDFVTRDGTSPEADTMGNVISKTRGGETSYLMKIPMELYKENRKAIDSEVDEHAEQLKPEHAQTKYSLLDGKGTYIKKSNIK